MTIPQADQKLIAQLQALIGELAGLQRGLHQPRAGCACDEQHLCALHAEVHHHLSQAADSLARAINKAQSEG